MEEAIKQLKIELNRLDTEIEKMRTQRSQIVTALSVLGGADALVKERTKSVSDLVLEIIQSSTAETLLRLKEKGRLD